MDERDNRNTTLPQITVLRIIWAALLIGQIVFLIVVLSLLRSGRLPPPKTDLHFFRYIAVGMLCLCILIGTTVRTIVLRSGRRNPVAQAVTFTTANIIFWASCEAPSVFAMVVMLLTRSTWPEILFVIVPMALQALTFPFAPERDRFGDSSRTRDLGR